MNYHPVFGAKKSDMDFDKIKQSPNFLNDKFINQTSFPMRSSTRSHISILRDFLKGNPQARPSKTIPVQPCTLIGIEGDKQAKIVWLGHSAFFLEIAGKKLLLDPMFSMYPSPFPPFGGKRFSERPINIDDLPDIDAVLLSHDHYDHLDFKTIIKIKDRIKQFHVPLGVGNHLLRWGIEPNKIYNHDWWEEYRLNELLLACTPAQHFSGRTLHKRNNTLWASWVIISEDAKIFFSGDGGYGYHFQEIGKKYGPFDVTLMECGQYDKRWKAIHMMPEETVQAHQDLQGKILIPMHWGAFTLALHSWTEPVERALIAAQAREMHISTPRIGETVLLGSAKYPTSTWWRL